VSGVVRAVVMMIMSALASGVRRERRNEVAEDGLVP
jgi:hypothetical protein